MASPRKVNPQKGPGAKAPERKQAAEKTRRSKVSPAKAKAKMVGKPATPPEKPKGKTTVKVSPVPGVPEKTAVGRKAVPSKPKAIPVEVKPAKPRKPVKPAVDLEWQKAVREALVHQRQRMLSVVQATQAQMAEQVGDLPDVSDRASEGYGDELAAGLLAIEAAQIDAVEAAIRRLDDGTYGLCLDCGRAIPRKRLEVLPFAQHCLACKGLKERTTQTLESQTADEEEEEPEGEPDNDEHEDAS